MKSYSVIRVAIFCLALSSAGHIAAKTSSGWVLRTGEVVMSSGAGTLSATGFSCSDEELAFAFTETVSPTQLNLSSRDRSSGSIDVSVTITQACAEGQVVFDYRHLAQEGSIGEDITISPANNSITAALAVQELDILTFQYQVPESNGSGSSDKTFFLRASGITVIADGTFSQSARSETLATITVTGGPPLDVENPGLAPDDDRTADAAEAFNTACESEAVAGTEFADVCATVGQEADTPEKVRQVAEAFDPNELSAVPAAAVEGGRIQASNVGGRLAALRGGATGISLDGIALAYNGSLFDASWLPEEMSEVIESGGGGGSSLLNERFGFFVNGDISLGDRNSRGREAGFDFDSWGLTTGIDYRFDNGFIGGLAIGFSRYGADLDDDGGALDSDTLSAQGYGTYSLTNDLYIDATLGYSRSDMDQKRVIDLSGFTGQVRSIAQGSTDAEQYSASLAANYRLPVNSSWSLTAHGQFFYAVNQINGFRESGSAFALEFPDQEFFTRSYSAGLRASKAISFNNGVLSPFANAVYTHEGGNDGYILRPSFASGASTDLTVEISSPDRNFGQLDAGVSWVFLSGQQLLFSYSALVGESDTTRHTFYLGARFEF